MQRELEMRCALERFIDEELRRPVAGVDIGTKLVGNAEILGRRHAGAADRAQQQNRNDKRQGSNRASRQDRYLRRLHNYENDRTVGTDSVETVMDDEERAQNHVDRPRAGRFRDLARASVCDDRVKCQRR